ncbi:MAG: rRNA maturation RNase YbeY [Thermodesulfobacteriota bacterium]
MGREASELSIVIVDDEQIRHLNRQYRQRSRPTNVISFPQQSFNAHPAQVLGDVVISIETAQRQAQKRGVQLEEEIIMLLIHGILHLLGYDHEGYGPEKKRMETKEQELWSLFLSSS